MEKPAKKLLADATFNFAEVLIEQANFQQALDHFEHAKNLYEEAATNAADDTENKSLSKELYERTIDRLDKVKSQHLRLVEKSSTYLQKLPSSPAQAIDEKPVIKIRSFTEKTSQSSKMKRKSNEKSIDSEAKKQKIDYQPLGCKELLDKFNRLNININLAELINSKKSFDEHRAIAHSNYAIFLIENLNNKEKSCTNSNKLKILNKAELLLRSSVEFYEKANLPNEKKLKKISKYT